MRELTDREIAGNFIMIYFVLTVLLVEMLLKYL